VIERETDGSVPAKARLDARTGDFERMIGLPGGRYTVASAPLWFGIGLGLTLTAALVLGVLAPQSEMCLMISFWCMGMLYAKWAKTSIQMRALRVIDVVPRRGDFVLSPGTSAEVLRRIRHAAERPKEFMLFRRIDLALSNLGNIGEVRDVGAVFESQADSDASAVDSSYTVVRSLIWTIPILGFIGTVVGLSDAIGSFTQVLNDTSGDSSTIKSNLAPVVGGLATAFETTLVALVAAVVIQLLSTWVFKREEALLDAITDYTTEHVLSRLKLTDWK
jgi:biopolymer transport protein ExbB/TolQ